LILLAEGDCAPLGAGATMAAASGSLGGIFAMIQPSNVAASGAMPGDGGNTR